MTNLQQYKMWQKMNFIHLLSAVIGGRRAEVLNLLVLHLKQLLDVVAQLLLLFYLGVILKLLLLLLLRLLLFGPFFT